MKNQKLNFRKLKTPESERAGMVFQLDAYFTVLFVVIILLLLQIIMVTGKHNELQGTLSNIQATVSTNGRKIMNVAPTVNTTSNDPYRIGVERNTAGGEIANTIFSELEKNKFDGVAEVTFYEYWHDPTFLEGDKGNYNNNTFDENNYFKTTGSGYYTKAFNYGKPVLENKYAIYESPEGNNDKNKTKAPVLKDTVIKTIKHSDFINTDKTPSEKEIQTVNRKNSTAKDTHISQYYSGQNQETSMGYFNLGINPKDLNPEVAESTRIAVVSVRLYSREPLIFTNPLEKEKDSNLIFNEIKTDDGKKFSLKCDFANGGSRLYVPLKVEKTWVLNSYFVADKAWRPYTVVEQKEKEEEEPEKYAEEWYSWLSEVPNETVPEYTFDYNTYKYKQTSKKLQAMQLNISPKKPSNVSNAKVHKNKIEAHDNAQIVKINCPNKIIAPKNLEWAFSNCHNLRNVSDIKNFSFENTDTVEGMFSGTLNLKQCPDLSLPMATNISKLFDGSSINKAPRINAPMAKNGFGIFMDSKVTYSPDIHLPNLEDGTAMFAYTPITKKPKIDVPKNCKLDGVFDDCNNLK